MRRVFLGLLTSLVLFPAAPQAQDARLSKLAANQGSSVGQFKAPRWSAEYITRIAAILEQHKRYPALAFLLRHQGTVV
jgi:hypothetical protein